MIFFMHTSKSTAAGDTPVTGCRTVLRDDLEAPVRQLAQPAPPGQFGQLAAQRLQSALHLDVEAQLDADVLDPGRAACFTHDAHDLLVVRRQRVLAHARLALRDGQMVFRAAELQRRAVGLDRLRAVAEDRTATEHDLQAALEGQRWIFGGRFVGEAARRRLVPGDEIDIPLIRGDGSLHIVELKRAMSLRKPLVKQHRGAWVPAADVHDAVGQEINYLVGLDENRQKIRRELGIETRRASAVVLIGHPAVQPDVPEQDINEALRTFNSHMSRVEVLTYKELIDNAERSLGSQEAGSPAASSPAEGRSRKPSTDQRLLLMRLDRRGT